MVLCISSVLKASGSEQKAEKWVEVGEGADPRANLGFFQYLPKELVRRIIEYVFPENDLSNLTGGYWGLKWACKDMHELFYAHLIHPLKIKMQAIKEENWSLFFECFWQLLRLDAKNKEVYWNAFITYIASGSIEYEVTIPESIGCETKVYYFFGVYENFLKQIRTSGALFKISSSMIDVIFKQMINIEKAGFYFDQWMNECCRCSSFYINPALLSESLVIKNILEKLNNTEDLQMVYEGCQQLDKIFDPCGFKKNDEDWREALQDSYLVSSEIFTNALVNVLEIGLKENAVDLLKITCRLSSLFIGCMNCGRLCASMHDFVEKRVKEDEFYPFVKGQSRELQCIIASHFLEVINVLNDFEVNFCEEVLKRFKQEDENISSISKELKAIEFLEDMIENIRNNV